MPLAEGVKGKFGYLSPEQARGGDIDGRSDVFSLGVTLWEMLVGRRLFAGKNELETLRNVLQKPVPPPSSVRPEIPAALDRIVLRALERNRDRRYRTAEELALDCELVVRDARADGQALRAFLNDLFAEESSSLSLDVPELPEELFASGPYVPVPSISAVPRDDQSLEIEVIEPSAPQGRARNPAPPFGVIAADASSPGVGTRRRARPAFWAGAALAAGLLVCLGLVRQRRHAPRIAVVAAPAPIPVAAPAPPAPVAVEPAPAVAAEPSVTRPEDGADVTEERRAHGRHRPPRAKELSTDLTLNPF